MQDILQYVFIHGSLDSEDFFPPQIALSGQYQSGDYVK